MLGQERSGNFLGIDLTSNLIDCIFWMAGGVNKNTKNASQKSNCDAFSEINIEIVSTLFFVFHHYQIVSQLHQKSQDTGLWLVEADHVTSKLASVCSICAFCPHPSSITCYLCPLHLLFLALLNITNRSGALKENKQTHFTFNIMFTKHFYVTLCPNQDLLQNR